MHRRKITNIPSCPSSLSSSPSCRGPCSYSYSSVDASVSSPAFYPPRCHSPSAKPTSNVSGNGVASCGPDLCLLTVSANATSISMGNATTPAVSYPSTATSKANETPFVAYPATATWTSSATVSKTASSSLPSSPLDLATVSANGTISSMATVTSLAPSPSAGPCPYPRRDPSPSPFLCLYPYRATTTSAGTNSSVVASAAALMQGGEAVTAGVDQDGVAGHARDAESVLVVVTVLCGAP
ncbi:hypothetical protein DENSPDRAFT_563412 [Dentipellis sp. KUC8613]|nr:hypothetical protein DENSPDRAFT_563412 [Dentipellis sp. KUC8613]